jgi:hypothetical protein
MPIPAYWKDTIHMHNLKKFQEIHKLMATIAPCLKQQKVIFIALNTELTIHALGGLNMHLLSVD